MGILTLASMRSSVHQRIVLSICFLAGGLGVGAWGANLPALGRRASLDEAALGMTLLAFATGAIAAMTSAPRIITRVGAERVAIVAAGLFGLGIAGVGLVTRLPEALCIAMLTGICFGSLDVAMNSQAASVERRAGRPIMSSFHAVFSAGTLTAALAYSTLAHRGLGSASMMALTGAMLAILSFEAFRQTLKGPCEPVAQDIRPKGAGAPRSGQRAALALGVLAFVIFMAEGAIMDWAAVYLVRVLGTSESLGAAGYAVFSGTMLLGRLLGDRANRHLGPTRLFRICVMIVVLSLGGFLAFGSLPIALCSLAFCGLAMANVIPILFSAAGRLGEHDGNRSLSRVLSMGYAGVLLGPAMIGFVAEASSLKASLSLVLLCLMTVALFGRISGSPPGGGES